MLIGGFWALPKSLGESKRTILDFSIISPEFSFSDKQKSMVIEYWLDNYQPAGSGDTLYLDILRLNTIVWPLPDWVDKTYYISEKRYAELFDTEFNTMFNESEARMQSLELPKKSGEKKRITIEVDPYYDYLISMSFINKIDNSSKTEFKLIGGNFLELTPRAGLSCGMEKVTKTSATVFCLPQMFYASKKDFANITLEVIDMQAEKIIPPVVYTKQASIQAIKDPNQSPPWCKPSDIIFLPIEKLLPGHIYMAKITVSFRDRTETFQKMFTTLK
jgi:hypothetical protein